MSDQTFSIVIQDYMEDGSGSTITSIRNIPHGDLEAIKNLNVTGYFGAEACPKGQCEFCDFIRWKIQKAIWG